MATSELRYTESPRILNSISIMTPVNILVQKQELSGPYTIESRPSLTTRTYVRIYEKMVILKLVVASNDLATYFHTMHYINSTAETCCYKVEYQNDKTDFKSSEMQS